MAADPDIRASLLLNHVETHAVIIRELHRANVTRALAGIGKETMAECYDRIGPIGVVQEALLVGIGPMDLSGFDARLLSKTPHATSWVVAQAESVWSFDCEVQHRAQDVQPIICGPRTVAHRVASLSLLAEELSVRESRRIGVAMTTTRLTPPKTLEGFDFTNLPDPFGPSLMREFGLAGSGPEVMAGA